MTCGHTPHPYGAKLLFVFEWILKLRGQWCWWTPTNPHEVSVWAWGLYLSYPGTISRIAGCIIVLFGLKLVNHRWFQLSAQGRFIEVVHPVDSSRGWFTEKWITKNHVRKSPSPMVELSASHKFPHFRNFRIYTHRLTPTKLRWREQMSWPTCQINTQHDAEVWIFNVHQCSSMFINSGHTRNRQFFRTNTPQGSWKLPPENPWHAALRDTPKEQAVFSPDPRSASAFIWSIGFWFLAWKSEHFI